MKIEQYQEDRLSLFISNNGMKRLWTVYFGSSVNPFLGKIRETRNLHIL